MGDIHIPTTESSSLYNNLEQMEVRELLEKMNQEDQKVPLAVAKAIPLIESFLIALVERMKQGGRLFYLGAGTSGRLGILDASEIPPTYGVEPGLVIGLIAGGDKAIRSAVEGAEDSEDQAWIDLEAFKPTLKDSIVGIAASGRTPYVINGLKEARSKGILTACITCNEGSAITQAVDFPIVAEAGPEFITGSTRMKAGTAQKLILNMITTSAMVQLGRVKGNKMVDMQLSNQKLVDRGVRMILDELENMDYNTAKSLLVRHGSVRKAVLAGKAEQSLISGKNT